MTGRVGGELETKPPYTSRAKPPAERARVSALSAEAEKSKLEAQLVETQVATGQELTKWREEFEVLTTELEAERTSVTHERVKTDNMGPKCAPRPPAETPLDRQELPANARAPKDRPRGRRSRSRCRNNHVFKVVLF